MAPGRQESLTYFFNQLRHGDDDAAARLWKHFGPRMLGLARRTLANHPTRIAGADDAVQDAFLSFWKRAKHGGFADDLHRENLWRLLGTITVRKVWKQLEKERTKKKGGGRVIGESSVAGVDGEPFRIDKEFAQIPAKDFDLACEELLLQLDGTLRSIALLKLMSHTNQEIADLLDRSVTSVENKLRLIRKIWKQELQH